jgi:hypothetical protein
MDRGLNDRSVTLRIGIMCYGTIFPSWQAWAIRYLLQVPGVEIALLIEDVTDGPPIKANLETHPVADNYPAAPASSVAQLKAFYWRLRERSCLWKLPKKVLWRLYLRLSNKLNAPQCDAHADLSPELQGVPVRKCSVMRRGYSEYFLNEDVEAIRACNLDVILRFAFNIVRGEILDTATHGVWSFHHDDHMKYRGSPPGFWEIYQDDPWSGAILQRLTDKLDDGVVIHHDKFKTCKHSYSANRNQLYMGTAKWPAVACRAIIAGVEASRIFMQLPASKAPIYRAPDNVQMLIYLARLFLRKLNKSTAELVKRKRGDDLNWHVGIIPEPVDQLLFRNTPLDVKWLKQAPGTFLADPFLLNKDGINYLFVEEYFHKTGKGHLSVIETQDFEVFSSPKIVLDRPFHLSYPCVFEYQGSYYCVPEQHQSGKVVLYEIQAFPYGWVERATLLADCPGVDPTLFEHDGRWWMFLTRQDQGDESALMLYHAESPFGPWSAHPGNPVSTARYRLRPAGPLFYWRGRFIRPAQNGTQRYGGSLVLHEILTITPTEYQERYFDEISPRPYWPTPDGLHTLVEAGSRCVIDANRVIH